MGKVAALTILVLVLSATVGCSPEGPDFTTEYPIWYLLNISTIGAPVACTYFGSNGDGLAGAGHSLYFIDRDAGIFGRCSQPPSTQDAFPLPWA